jgi:hypothetical protein
MTQPDARTDSPQNHEGGCLLRLSWMLGGNLAVLLIAVAIAQGGGTFFSFADAFFWLVVLAMVGIRYVDITRMKGLTAGGKPATLADWKRYVVILLAASLGLWGLAHGLAYVL